MDRRRVRPRHMLEPSARELRACEARRGMLLLLVRPRSISNEGDERRAGWLGSEGAERKTESAEISVSSMVKMSSISRLSSIKWVLWKGNVLVSSSSSSSSKAVIVVVILVLLAVQGWDDKVVA
jgi:hypothetical protein